MYIKTLKLYNVKLFKDEIIKFDKGLNLILGLNSVGKSSIFTIINWTLWSTKRGIENILRRGESECSIEMVYNSNKTDYRLVKSYNIEQDELEFQFFHKKEESDHWVSILNSKMGSKQAQLKNKIEESIGIKESTFMTLLYFEQKKFYEIIYGGSEIRSFMDYILNITQINHLYNVIDGLEKDFKRDIENEDLITHRMTELNGELDYFKNELSLCVRNISDLTTKLKNLKSENAVIIDIHNKIDAVSNTILYTNNLWHEILVLDNIVKENQGFYNKAVETYGSVDVLKQEIEDINTKIRDYEKEIEQLEIMKIKLEKQKSELEMGINRANSIIKEITALEGDDKGQGKCPVCRQIVAKEHIIDEVKKEETKIEEITIKIDEIIDKIQSLKTNYEKIKKELGSLRSKQANINTNYTIVDEKLNKMNADVRKYNQIIEQFNTKLEAIKNIDTIVEEYNTIVDQEYYIDLTDAMKIDTQKYTNAYYKQLHKLAIIESYIQIFTAMQQTVNSKFMSYTDIYNDNQSKLNEYLNGERRIKDKISIITDSIKSTTDKLNQISILKHNQKIYIHIKNVITTIVKEVRDSKIQNLQSVCYKWYNQLVAIPQIKSLKINPTQYSIEIWPNDIDKENYVDLSNLSGGNATLLAVALRLALIKNISEPLILIDEPTDGTDSTNVEAEINGIAAISNFFPQVLMITHHQIGLKNADNVIEIEKDQTTNISKIVK